MIQREFSAERINRVLNDPSVRGSIEFPGLGEIDVGAIVADPRHFVLMTEDGFGGVIFECHEPGVYEAHTQFLPEGRGKRALQATREALHYMFTRTDCFETLTKVPAGNRPALALAKRVGGALDFVRNHYWPTSRGLIATSFYSLRYPDWVRTSPDLPAFGRWFHDRLEAEKTKVGSSHNIHDDEDCHDRHVGSAVAMIMGGQVAKAIVLYNRWARFAGYGDS